MAEEEEKKEQEAEEAAGAGKELNEEKKAETVEDKLEEAEEKVEEQAEAEDKKPEEEAVREEAGIIEEKKEEAEIKPEKTEAKQEKAEAKQEASKQELAAPGKLSFSEAEKAGPQKEDEFMAMMREEEEEKKAALKQKEEEEIPAGEVEAAEEEIGLIKKKEKKPRKRKAKEAQAEEEMAEGLTEESSEPKIYALRTTANREDQVMDFLSSNATRKKLEVFSVIRPHGMRGYIFIESATRNDAEQAAFGVPYARGLLPSIIQYSEIEHMLEQVKKEANIQKNDIAEIISGPFKREKCKITRIDRTKEEVVVELLEAAVPIPLTLKMDAVRVIRRDSEGEPEAAEK